MIKIICIFFLIILVISECIVIFNLKLKEINTKRSILAYRARLVFKTEQYHEMSKDPNASPCGEHYDRGIADGFIKARAELEDMFVDYWD